VGRVFLPHTAQLTARAYLNSVFLFSLPSFSSRDRQSAEVDLSEGESEKDAIFLLRVLDFDKR